MRFKDKGKNSNGTVELLWLREWKGEAELTAEFGRWMGNYNRHYLHSALGYSTPMQTEENYEFSHGTILNVA